MPNETIPLPELDEVTVTILVDNSVDVLMAGSPVAHRFPLRPDLFDHPFPIAEHGFSALLRVRHGDDRATVLFDTGVSRQGFLHNLDALAVNVQEIQAVVLSHGHADHALGLPGLVQRLGERSVPLVIHPEAYLERRMLLPDGSVLQLPPPRLADFRHEAIEVIEEVGPSMLVDGAVLVSGEVGRTTEFERGLPPHQANRGGVWESDPLIRDDQCAIMNLRGKGLVIVTGCGHAGIINIVHNAQRLTGIQQVHAVIGGFHLTGGLFEPIIPATVAALQAIGPQYVVPGHCTGWSALHQIARGLPDAYLAISAGSTFVFDA